MVEYVCSTCTKVFTQKGHYDSHIARKRPCKKNDTIETIIEQKVQEALVKASVVPAQTAPIPQRAIVKPFLKWVGGKTQIIDTVLSKFPNEMHHYHEPFLGGGSVLLALLTHKANGTRKITGTIYASDLNSNLIGLYKNIQTNPDTLVQHIKLLVEEFSKSKGDTVNRKPTTLQEAMTSPESYYYWIRSSFNALGTEQRTSIQGSAMLLFLNKTCFRGVYREGPHGFNVPYGNYTNPSILDEQHIKDVSKLFQGVVFTHQSFTESLKRPTEGDFVYLDPPYAPINETSFVGYTTDGFNLDAHKQLFQLCSAMKAKKVNMLLSNAQVPLVTNAFPASQGYTTTPISCRRAIHSKTPDARTNEVLITN